MGFNTYKRDGIQLSGAFVATVDADMRVGAVEETVTVTGETPIVDVQTSQQQRVLDKDVVRDIPTSRQYYSVVALIPGINMTAQSLDVGGSASPNVPDFVIHGGRQGDGRLAVDGVSVGQRGGGGTDGGIDRSMFLLNVGAVQETAVSTSGGLGESQTSGVSINLVPREGGNTHRGSFYTAFANASMQGNNYTAALQAQGLRTPNQLDKVWEVTAQEGGPLIKDKLWYFMTARDQGNRNLVAGMYYNLNAGDVTKWTYEPDLNRRANLDDTWRTVSMRLTYQASMKDKIGVYFEEQDRKTGWIGGGTATSSPEATPNTISNPDRAYSATWARPQTNRLLFEGGFGGTTLQWGAHGRPEFNPNLIQVTDVGANAFVPGITYRQETWNNNWLQPHQMRGSVSYVSGTHTAKFGFTQQWIHYDDRTGMDGQGLSYRFNNGSPNQFTISATPRKRLAHVNTTGLYAQDSWKLNRLTVQAGVRYDHIHALYPEQVVGPVQYLPITLDIPQTEGASVHDITPRFAATYDVFGNGKTAVKFSLGKYIQAGEVGAWGELENPTLRLAFSTNRTWQDNNKNFIPDCNLFNPAAQSPATTGSIDTCGAYATQNYAQVLKGNLVYNNTYDPAITSGWGKRAYNWELSASVQHQLLPRVGVDIGYFRRWYGNQLVTDNLAYDGRFGCGTPTDHSGCFDTFNYTVPVDPRLPGGGGNTITNFVDVKPVAFGQTNNFITSVDNFGGVKEYWQGIDVNANARGFKGLTVQGGISTGRMSIDECNLAARLPETFLTGQTLVFDATQGNFQTALSRCSVHEPFLTQFKGLAAYVVPRFDVLVSTTWQSLPGSQVTANFNAPNSAIQGLGRLISGTTNATQTTPLNLVESGALYSERVNLLDLRFAKVIRYKRTRMNAGVDLYNSFNTNKGTAFNQTYSSATANYLTPTSIVPARFVKLNLQFDF
jgi:hypothetical protein